MKRSHVIRKIAAHMKAYDMGLSPTELNGEAEYILSMLENEGMLPPKHPTKTETDLNGRDNVCYEWEE